MVAAPRREPLSDVAVWSLMTALYVAVGRAVETEMALVKLVSALALELSARNTARQGREGEGA